MLRRAEPQADCPVDILILTEYSGPIDARAVGEPVAARALIDAMFEPAFNAPPARFEIDERGGSWRFRVLVRRPLHVESQPQLQLQPQLQ